MSVRVVEVRGRRDLNRFIGFPDKLYRGCPQYVPALHPDQRKSLMSCSSLSYCSRKMWLAYRDGDIVGRICGIINPRYNEIYNTKRARFGWFDTIDDLEVAGTLIRTAASWAAQEGMTEIHGPLYYNTLGKQGMLVDGFENTPPFNCIYNYPYYPKLVESLGFRKECDWIQYKLDMTQPLPDKTVRLSSLLEQRYDIRIGNLDIIKKDPAAVRKFFDMYSESFSKSVYNFIPFTEEEKQEEAAGVMPFVSDRSSCVLLDSEGEPVAFGISFPSISGALQKARGHLFPFGWLHLLRAMNDYRMTDLMLTGATGDWQGRGISSIFYREIHRKAALIGNKWSITNPQIESNSAVNIWNSYDRQLYMRRRCYIASIADILWIK